MKRAEQKTRGARASLRAVRLNEPEARPSLDGTTGETPVLPASVDVCTCLPDAFSNAMHPARQRASVMIFAVLLLAAGVFVLAGIAQLAATQALVGVNEWDALDRRVRLENSRAMARQYVLQQMFRSVNTNTVTFTNASLGGFTLKPENTMTPSPEPDYHWQIYSTTNVKINPFTLMERGGVYRAKVDGNISDGATNFGWTFLIRTRSPIAAGYPVVQHLPASADISALTGSMPYIDMRTNNIEKFVGFQEMARVRVSSMTHTNSYDTSGYDGYLGVPSEIKGSDDKPVTYYTNWLPEPYGASNVLIKIDLGFEDPYSPGGLFVCVVPDTASYTNTNTVPPTTNQLPVAAVKLVGTDEYYHFALQVRVDTNNTNVQTLILEGSNDKYIGRPVYFNYQRAAGSTNTLHVVTTNASWTGKWRIGITAAHCNIQFDDPITIVGGIRTDGNILNMGNLTLEQEPDPGGLDDVADRMMWLEDYRDPSQDDAP